MKWGIIGAMEEEVALLKEKMQVEKECRLCGCTYLDGRLLGQPATVVCCNVGKINAALCANNLIRTFGVEAVVNVGIAGGMLPDLAQMEVVVATDAVLHDVDPVEVDFYPFRLEFEADEQLSRAALQAAQQVGARCRRGRVATGDQFVCDSRLKEEIARRCAPACVEMEGAAIAQACFANDTPFAIIRTISDSADDQVEQSYPVFKKKAAAQSAAILLRMLEDAPG